MPEENLLSYLEAILRVYNLSGRRDNKYKARIKILLNAEGPEEFSRLVEEEWAQIKEASIDLPPAEIARIQDYFAPPPFEDLVDGSAAVNEQREIDGAFDQWLRINTVAHKKPGYAIVNVSLKAIGAIPWRYY